MTVPHPTGPESPSERLCHKLRTEFTFQISVDTDTLPKGLAVASAAIRAGVTLLEMGTPLIKCEGVRVVVPAFRERFADALLLADMKTMDGGAFEARTVFEGGGNIIDFLAAAGTDTARDICSVRDAFRSAEPGVARLVFADILVPHQGPARKAVEVALRMVDAGVDGVGLHLQHDARRANPALMQSGELADIAAAVHERVGDAISVQVVGGLSIEQAKALARAGLRAFVISGNLGQPDGVARYGLPPQEIERHIAEFIQQVSGLDATNASG